MLGSYINIPDNIIKQTNYSALPLELIYLLKVLFIIGSC